MPNGIVLYLKSLIPQRKEEEILLDTHNIIETLFLLVIKLFQKIPGFKLKRKGNTTVGRFYIDLTIIFLFLEFISLELLMLSTPISPEDPARIIYFFEISIIIFFISISWTGFVYLNQKFRNLVETKILSIQTDHAYSSESGYYTFIREFFNGRYYEWQSGKGFRYHLRSILYLGFIIPATLMIAYKPISQLLFQVVTNCSIELIISLLLLIFTLILNGLYLLIILYILFTVGLILFFLSIVVHDFPIEINPLIEMGGTKDYSNIVIKSTYLASFSLASIPLLSGISKLGSINEIEITLFTNQTFGNITSEFKNSLVHSVENLSINSFSTYFSSVFILIVVIAASLIIMVLLHNRIKERKQELIQRIESQISSIDFIQTENQNDLDRQRYLLEIYDKIINSSEWPIKKTFVVELMISAVPIVITHLL
jgi:hypothetical protein